MKLNLIRRIRRKKPKSAEDKVLFYELKELLNFTPRNLNKYKKAFTHRSVQMSDEKGNPINYER